MEPWLLKKHWVSRYWKFFKDGWYNFIYDNQNDIVNEKLYLKNAALGKTALKEKTLRTVYCRPVRQRSLDFMARHFWPPVVLLLELVRK